MSPVIKYSLTLLLFLVLVGCGSSLPSSKESVLIIAVSGLNADEFGDGSTTDNITPNLEKLVKESIRFTHAYTTSPLEASGLASIFTGLYPSEHGIRTNGASTFDSGVQSITEENASRKYMSFLLSGGPPVLRKSGISRGFNDFDDGFKADSGFFMPARDLSEKFLNIYENRMEANKFYGVIYFADLLFLGPSNKDKTLQEIDEAFGKIRNKLIEYKTWDELTVVFTSLRGQGRFEGIYDDTVRIPLVIKPSRQHRDLSPFWKIDWPVTFADVGKTLYKVTGVTFKNKTKFEIKDFSNEFVSKKYEDSERVLFIESDLLKWRGWGPRLFALREGEWVLFPVLKKLYNTYLDRSQINNMYGKDTEITKSLEGVWNTQSESEKNSLLIPENTDAFYKINVAKILFSPQSLIADVQNVFSDFFMTRKDWQVVQWYLRTLFERKEIEKMKRTLSKIKPSNKSEAKELALWRRSVGLEVKNMIDCEPALAWLKAQSLEKHRTDILRECKDKETQNWLQSFAHYKVKKNRDASALYDVARSITDKRVRQAALGKYFWLNSATWDLPTDVPGEFAVFEFFMSQVDSQEFENFVKKKPNF